MVPFTPPPRPCIDDALALLNPWQRDFPLVREPFAVVARSLGLGWTTNRVLETLSDLQDRGLLSRIGGVFSSHAGGSALLAAMAVPMEHLDLVANLVSAHPGVNHNYEREHHYNLWFVMTARDDHALESALCTLEQSSGFPALRLRMLRPYHIDLGFDLRHATAGMPLRLKNEAAPPVSTLDVPLAALVEAGLPLEERPFDNWARTLCTSPDAVLATLKSWLETGTLRRWGAIVRHHEFGFDANAMAVFDVPDEHVDACGALLACQDGVTLAYRRERAHTWPYNLYCMVHGCDRLAVQTVINGLIARCDLTDAPHAVLFSRRRFKQTGGRRFREHVFPAEHTAHVVTR